jgi:acyl carrier protein
MEALRDAWRAEALLQDFGDRRRLAAMRHTRAQIHFAAGEHLEAEEAAAGALKISQKENDQKLTLAHMFFLLEVRGARLQKQVTAVDDLPKSGIVQTLDLTIRLAKEAIGVSRKTGDMIAEGGACDWVAHFQLMAGRPAEAQKAAEEALTIARNQGELAGQASALLKLAQAQVQLRDEILAMESLAEASVLATEAGDQRLIALISELEELVDGREKGAETKPRDAASKEARSQFEAKEAKFKGPDPKAVELHIMGIVKNLNTLDTELDTPLLDSGVDSLGALELRSTMARDFMLSLPSTLIFNYPTIGDLARFITQECTDRQIAWGH